MERSAPSVGYCDTLRAANERASGATDMRDAGPQRRATGQASELATPGDIATALLSPPYARTFPVRGRIRARTGRESRTTVRPVGRRRSRPPRLNARRCRPELTGKQRAAERRPTRRSIGRGFHRGQGRGREVGSAPDCDRHNCSGRRMDNPLAEPHRRPSRSTSVAVRPLDSNSAWPHGSRMAPPWPACSSSTFESAAGLPRQPFCPRTGNRTR